jgi:hypothetical protein
MKVPMNRRELLRLMAAGGATYLTSPYVQAGDAPIQGNRLISPGCRRSKVKVAKIYLGVQGSHYPNPDLDMKKEVQFYESQFTELKDELSDVEFVVNELVSSVDQFNK